MTKPVTYNNSSFLSEEDLHTINFNMFDSFTTGSNQQNSLKKVKLTFLKS